MLKLKLLPELGSIDHCGKHKQGLSIAGPEELHHINNKHHICIFYSSPGDLTECFGVFFQKLDQSLKRLDKTRCAKTSGLLF